MSWVQLNKGRGDAAKLTCCLVHQCPKHCQRILFYIDIESEEDECDTSLLTVSAVAKGNMFDIDSVTKSSSDHHRAYDRLPVAGESLRPSEKLQASQGTQKWMDPWQTTSKCSGASACKPH